MSQEKETEPVAKIELTSYSCVEDIQHLIERLNNTAPYRLEYVRNPELEEPDFYLVAEVDE